MKKRAWRKFYKTRRLARWLPLLVVEADLYEYDVSACLLRRISRAAICKSYRGEFSARFRIDVIHEDELPNYLHGLRKDFSDIATQIGKEQVSWQTSVKHEHNEFMQKRREEIITPAANL